MFWRKINLLSELTCSVSSNGSFGPYPVFINSNHKKCAMYLLGHHPSIGFNLFFGSWMSAELLKMGHPTHFANTRGLICNMWGRNEQAGNSEVVWLFYWTRNFSVYSRDSENGKMGENVSG